MCDYQFHSFPFYKFLKENKLETGGMNQNHIHTSSFTSSQQAKVQVGTTGNG